MAQDDFIYPSSPDGQDTFHLEIPGDLQGYRKLYGSSIANRAEFWSSQARRLSWDTPFTSPVTEDFAAAKVTWFGDGYLNACNNALDIRIESGDGDNAALVYVSDGENTRRLSYSELRTLVIRLAGALKKQGLAAGDRVALYLPDCPETAIMMLACARLGITYVPIPARFTAEIAAEIVHDCGASLVLMNPASANQSYNARATTVIDLLNEKVSIVSAGEPADGATVIDRMMADADPSSGETCASMKAEHPVFILYANSAAGVPRGSVFPTAGFMVQAAVSFDIIFCGQSEHTGGILCTLDLASAAGQSYGLWGALLNGTAVIISAHGEESNAALLAGVLEAYPSAALITSPGMLASLRGELNGGGLPGGGKFPLIVCSGDVLSPRLVAFAGESLASGPERVLNMWIQSESGASLISTFPHHALNRPGALGLPQPGVTPRVLNTMGQACRPNESGQLVFEGSWPAMVRGIWGQTERYRELYFQRNPGFFSTNDGVREDNEGFIWFMGRIDDVIKVRGQSLATSEIEAVLVAHPDVEEAAVVTVVGEESGRLFAFIAVDREKTGSQALAALEADLSALISRRIGEFAVPNRFAFGRELPRTRTGKVVRRLLRRIATGDISIEEDLSHVANPGAVQELLQRKGS